MYKTALLTLTVMTGLLFKPVFADDAAGKSAISAELSSTGIGFDYIYGLSSNFHARASINGAKVSFDFEGDNNNGVQGDELQYEGDLDLFTLGGMVDWYPAAGNFRVSLGLFYNDNNLNGSARCESESGTCEFGDNEDAFDRRQLGTVEADVEFNPVAPYIGIGYGNPLDQAGWGFSGDVGVLFQGSPDVELRSRGDCNVVAAGFTTPLECTAQRDAALEEEEREIENDVESLQVYPVINIAVTYRFE